MCLRKKRFRYVVCLSLFFCLMLGMAPGIAADGETDFLFRDVPDSHWAYDAIRFVFQGRLMRGTSPVTFAPGETLSRAMVATILYRMAGEPPTEFRTVFDDVAAGQWYSKAVVWAHGNQIVFGVGNDRFAPDELVTREAFVAMLYRYAEVADIDTDTTTSPYPPYGYFEGFIDRPTVSDWAEDAVRWAVGAGLISGKTNTTLAPRDTATRAECATILMRWPHTSIDVKFDDLGSTCSFYPVLYNGSQLFLARSREDMVNILSTVNWEGSAWELDGKYGDAYFAEHYIIVVPYSVSFTVDGVLLERDRMGRIDRLFVHSTMMPTTIYKTNFWLIGVDNTLLGNVQYLWYTYPTPPPPTM